ncbi:hypothetical protein Pint_22320 [Pistacia integerrima]|uniref:Uncharacterized protein n=1 Tax=Pistacia integerrima TaxID=434235 RepID=A0ACC0YIL0_9ROSI|nr:hypothetical protein Pint_22320 [Pistacia integerrima]
MDGIAATSGASVSSVLALKLSSTLLFSAAARMMVTVNKIQPSRLAKEQYDVKEAMEKVLALDQAYPLPLLGKMIEKFPKTFEHAVWWLSNHS